MRTLALSFLLLLGIVAMGVPTASAGGVTVAVTIAPPLLPVYEQPICPGDGYIWTPGYWAYGDDGYYWVPGTWVLAPEVGFLWTPPYWGFVDGAFIFHEGYWGPHVGFYGGVNYGFGYFGVGFDGGRWENGHFFYNRAVTRINERVIHNVYNVRVNERGGTRVSYKGGAGGIRAHATAEEEAAARERHTGPTGVQQRHMQAARGNPEFRASANHGKPTVAATEKPGEFKGRGAVAARAAGGPYHAEESRAAANRGVNGKGEAENRAASEKRASENRAAESRTRAVHARNLPPAERPAKPNTGNAKQDEKYQRQQDKLMAKQEQERQKLQQRQDREHEQLGRQRASDARQRQVEQKHQQQTERMAQQHAAQVQKMQQRQRPPETHSASKTPSGGRPERP